MVESEIGLTGDAAAGATKEVITETGVTVRTPLFVSEGDTIKDDIPTGAHITHVSPADSAQVIVYPGEC